MAPRAEVFAALGDETRLRLVSRLADGGRLSIARLTDGTRLTRQAVSKHLVVLRGAGLVRARRAGREQLYELEPRRIDDARRFLDAMSQRWDQTLARLREMVEDE